MSIFIKKSFSIIALVLCVCLICNTSVYASTNEHSFVKNGDEMMIKEMGIYPKGNNYSKKCYYDGVPFNVTVDNNYNVKLKSTYNNQKVDLTYYAEGAAYLNYEENGKLTKYDLKINELTSNSIDIEVYNGSKLIKHYTDIAQLENTGYSGQIAISAATIALISLCISALIVLGILDIVQKEFTKHQYDWYNAKDAVKVIASNDKLKNDVFPALRSGNYTYIALYNPMSVSQASTIIATNILDTYTFSQATAANVIKSNGFWLQSAIPDPAHISGKTSGVFFKHFHTSEHAYYQSDFHSFFGEPTILN